MDASQSGDVVVLIGTGAIVLAIVQTPAAKKE
jgi:hypothetical protein